jgi:hypothetical protein
MKNHHEAYPTPRHVQGSSLLHDDMELRLEATSSAARSQSAEFMQAGWKHFTTADYKAAIGTDQGEHRRPGRRR